MAMFFTQRILPGPVWLHFFLVGAVLYGVMSVVYPAPKPVLGPPNPSRLDVMAESYAKMVGAPPSDGDVARFIELELRDELLFREALARKLHQLDPVIEQRILRNMRFLDPGTVVEESQLVADGLGLNMHLTDEVIRRRLVQVMTQLLIAGAGLEAVTDGQLAAAYEARRGSFLEPARVNFSHVFLGEVTREEALEVLADIEARALPVGEAIRLGRAFLSGFNFTGLSWADVGSRLGREFAATLRSRVEVDGDVGWMTPVESVYGMHLVYVQSYENERPQTFDEVAEKLRWDLKTEREQAALDAAVATLMAQYEVQRS